MDEYKKLLIVQCAIDNLEGVAIPSRLLKDIQIFREWTEQRITEIEKK